MEQNFLLTIHDATFICAISSQMTVENLNTCNVMIIRDKWNQGDKQYSCNRINIKWCVLIEVSFENLWSVVYNYNLFSINENVSRIFFD